MAHPDRKRAKQCKMALHLKIILSISAVLSLLYQFTFMFPAETYWLVPTMEVYRMQTLSLFALSALQVGYLLYRLWSYKQVKRETKLSWTFLLVCFYAITSLIYIWYKEKSFIETNEQR